MDMIVKIIETKNKERERRVKFLEQCICEFLRRISAQKVKISDDLIKNKVNEFLELIAIEDFIPTQSWIDFIKDNCIYDRKGERKPPTTLDFKKIMTYCSKRNVSGRPTPTFDPPQLEERCKRKLIFLENCLLEYMYRMSFYKIAETSEKTVMKVVNDLQNILHIENLKPDKIWYRKFEKSLSFFLEVKRRFIAGPAPSRSLDLKDIISYCSMLEADNRSYIKTHCEQTLEPSEKEPATPQKIIGPPVKVSVGNFISNSKKEPKIAEYIKRPQIQISLKSCHPPTPLTLVPATPCKENLQICCNIPAKISIVPKQLKASDFEIIDLPSGAHKEEECILPDFGNENSNEESSSNSWEFPPLKIQRVESIASGLSIAASSPESSTQQNIEKSALCVKNYTDALELLKPIEEFVLLQENYRAIGLISQLEEIFKKPPNKK